jgi:hypothetical protein
MFAESKRGASGRLSLLVLLTLCGAGCSTDAVIHVDNGREQSMVLVVDGKEVATIPAGEAKFVRCPPGEKRLQVRCGEEVIFEETKQVKEHGGYLLNPDDRHRYWTYTVKYGSSRFEGLVEAAVKSVVDDQRNQTQIAYQELLSEVDLLPPDMWLEIPSGVRHVLREPPEMVLTKRGMEKHTVLWRMDPNDYTLLEAARQNHEPSEADLRALEEVIDRVFETAP